MGLPSERSECSYTFSRTPTRRGLVLLSGGLDKEDEQSILMIPCAVLLLSFALACAQSPLLCFCKSLLCKVSFLRLGAATLPAAWVGGSRKNVPFLKGS